MSEISRFGVSVEDELLQSFDALIAKRGYGNRSEALRDLMRDALIKNQIEDSPQSSEVLGSLTLVYNHHAADLQEKMTEIQHGHHGFIVSMLHVHINHEDCMEVIVLRGDVKRIRTLANSLLSLKGVKHGDLFVTLPTKKMIENQDHPNGHPHKL